MQRFSLVILASSTASLALASAASASVVINQPFTSQPSDWTANTSGGGTIGFTNSDLDVSGFAGPNDSATAYEAYTTPSTMTYTTAGLTRTGELTIAFDVKFNTTELAISNEPNDPTYNRGGDDNPLLSVFGGGNNPLANFDMYAYGWGSTYQYAPSLSAGIEWGGGNTLVGDGPGTIPASAIDGQTYHVVLNITVTDGGVDPANTGQHIWTVADTLTMSNASNTFTLDTTKQADGDYDPLDSALNFNIGTVGFGDGTPQQGLTRYWVQRF
jgi:hypothetical protein